MKNLPDNLPLSAGERVPKRVEPLKKCLAHGVRRQSAAATALLNSDDDQWLSRATQSGVSRTAGLPPHSKFSHRAFSLIEIMMVVTLLTLIMVALMSVFSSTQTAFRASLTQTDVLEGGRAAMDLITGDLRQLAPSGGYNAATDVTFNDLLPPSYIGSQYPNTPSNAINFWVSSPFSTIVQPLVGATDQQMRTNQVQSVFILTYQNQLWHGVGYFVDTNSQMYVDPLYRYDSNLAIAMTNLPARPSPAQIFTNFCSVVATPNLDPATNVTHLLDGVLHFTVRAYDNNGLWLTNGFTAGQPIAMPVNSFFYPTLTPNGEVSFFMCSNTLPAAVEIQMGVVEDRILQRASSFPSRSIVQSNYLAQQVGKVHLFRQRVTIPNVDLTTY